MGKIRAGVVGVGHLGMIHARIYHELEGVDFTAVCDTERSRAEEASAKWGARAVSSIEEFAGLVDAASVAVPTVDHYKIAAFLLEKGVHVLVEKPLTSTIEEGRKLVDLSRRTSAKLQVGHVERFNPAVMAAEKHIRTPLFIEVHRLSPFSFRSADIDVVLDLMIHDLDIISHLVKSEVEKVDAVGVPILSEKVDIANARILYRSGCVANVTASRVSAKKMRKIRVFSKDAYLSIDYGDRVALMFRKSDKVKSGEIQIPKLAGMRIDNPLEFFLKNVIQVEEVAFSEHEPLKKEIESFVQCVAEGTAPEVPGEQGLEAMSAAEAVNDAIRRHMRLVSSEGRILHGEIEAG